MIKKTNKYLLLFSSLGIIVFTSATAFSELSKLEDMHLHDDLRVKTPVMMEVKTKDELEAEDDCFPPHLLKDFTGFKEAMGFRESRGNYFAVNELGYIGKYQFAKKNLIAYGVKNYNEFLNSPELQERVFRLSVKRTKWIMRKEIQKFEGIKIANVNVTESGIIAASHLAGAKNVKRFLNTRGQYEFRDANGTSIRHYMKYFADYDLSEIEPKQYAKL